MTTSGIQQIQSFQFATPKTINRDYLLYLPKEYDTDQSRHWPFILFLHGAGERGSNLTLVKSQGLAKRLQKWEDFQFVVSDEPAMQQDQLMVKVITRYAGMPIWPFAFAVATGVRG